MALVTCPECGRERVSSSAESCPTCGYGIKAHLERDEEERCRREAEQAKEARVFENITRPPRYDTTSNRSISLLPVFFAALIMIAAVLSAYMLTKTQQPTIEESPKYVQKKEYIEPVAADKMSVSNIYELQVEEWEDEFSGERIIKVRNDTRSTYSEKYGRVHFDIQPYVKVAQTDGSAFLLDVSINGVGEEFELQNIYMKTGLNRCTFPCTSENIVKKDDTLTVSINAGSSSHYSLSLVLEDALRFGHDVKIRFEGRMQSYDFDLDYHTLEIVERLRQFMRDEKVYLSYSNLKDTHCIDNISVQKIEQGYLDEIDYLMSTDQFDAAEDLSYLSGMTVKEDREQVEVRKLILLALDHHRSAISASEFNQKLAYALAEDFEKRGKYESACYLYNMLGDYESSWSRANSIRKDIYQKSMDFYKRGMYYDAAYGFAFLSKTRYLNSRRAFFECSKNVEIAVAFEAAFKLDVIDIRMIGIGVKSATDMGDNQHKVIITVKNLTKKPATFIQVYLVFYSESGKPISCVETTLLNEIGHPENGIPSQDTKDFEYIAKMDHKIKSVSCIPGNLR